MHEMSVAQNILEIINEHVGKHEQHKVRSISLKVGELAGIVSESLEFCFLTIVNNTPLAHAKLQIKSIPITAECGACNHVSQLDYGIFFCEKCRSSEIKLLSGKELQVVQIELDD
jgi:hydrogenase nickel incorporation protein HypA/HybF